MTVQLSPKDAWKKIRDGALVLDVRTPKEFEAGHLSMALNIPHELIEKHVEAIGPDKNREVVVHCKSGGRSQFVVDALRGRGYVGAFNGMGYDDLAGAE